MLPPMAEMISIHYEDIYRAAVVILHRNIFLVNMYRVLLACQSQGIKVDLRPPQSSERGFWTEAFLTNW